MIWKTRTDTRMPTRIRANCLRLKCSGTGSLLISRMIMPKMALNRSRKANVPYTASIPRITSLLRMTMAKAQNSTDRRVSRAVVRANWPMPFDSGMSRMTFNGRVLAACTMGIKPKIKAVTRPMSSPPTMVKGLSTKATVMPRFCMNRRTM